VAGRRHGHRHRGGRRGRERQRRRKSQDQNREPVLHQNLLFHTVADPAKAAAKRR
jgi:hypothetical protein